MGGLYLEIQTSNRLKKAVAILLLVLFLVSLTAIATSAKTSKACKGKPSCGKGMSAVCNNGKWDCFPKLPKLKTCTGHKPSCSSGKHAFCNPKNGKWECLK